MNFTADQISHLVNGTVVGDGSVTVNTFAKIEDCLLYTSPSPRD